MAPIRALLRVSSWSRLYPERKSVIFRSSSASCLIGPSPRKSSPTQPSGLLTYSAVKGKLHWMTKLVKQQMETTSAPTHQ
eukprot:scaffold8805_cov109-Cylindrotheca_fusiformis.AAC.2